MATLLELAQEVETTYQGSLSNSVVVCRPQMGQPLSDTNYPFYRETGSVDEFAQSGLIQGYIIVKAKTSSAGDISMLQIGCVKRQNNNNAELTTEGRKFLDDYKKSYRPFDTEDGSLWTHVLNHFATTRNLRFVVKIDAITGTPARGRVNGLHLVGDGITDTTAYNEYWAFEATAPYDTPGNIKSWKY
jgi:hypothetical protein